MCNSLKRLQRKRKNRAKKLQKQRESYLAGEAPRKDWEGNKIRWMDGVKSLFPSRATGKLRCSSPSGEHDWVISRGGTFFRCGACKVSTYNSDNLKILQKFPDSRVAAGG